MRLNSLVLIACSFPFLSSCTGKNSSPDNNHDMPAKTAWAASAVQDSRTRNPAIATTPNGTGILELPDGSKFSTSLYQPKVIGQLRTARKMPYYILSGRGCQECDANTSIYIHSPSDGPMKDEGGQARFAYPGREVSYEDSKPVYEARMFFGDCVAGHPVAAVWFQHFLADDRQWHNSVFVAEVKDDSLVSKELAGQVPKISEAEEAVAKGHCQEVPGTEQSTEP